MFGNWLKFAWDANMLALESQRVIAMRLAKLSMGGAGATKEAERMVREKMSKRSKSRGERRFGHLAVGCGRMTHGGCDGFTNQLFSDLFWECHRRRTSMLFRLPS